MNRICLLRTVVAAAVVLWGASAHATVIRVPGDFSLLRPAIGAAAPGDTVQIAGNGGSTYPTSNLLIDKDLTLQGGWRVDFAVRDPDLYVSVLLDTTRTSTSPVIRITGSPSVEIDGVQIIGGRSGISAREGADLKVRNCVIRDQRNTTTVADPTQVIGTGIRAFGGTVLIEDTIFRGIVSSYPGAGVGLVDVTSARIVDSVIRNSLASTVSRDGSGGGIYASGVSSLIIERSTINGTATIQRGGAAYLLNTAAVVTDCQFTDGLASTVGGGFYLDQCPSASFVRCRFENGRGTLAGAIFAVDSGSLSLDDVQFVNNRASQESGAIHLERTPFTITNCVFDSNHQELFPVVVPNRGGAVFSVESSGSVTATTFVDERAVGKGGAWSQVGGTVNFQDCRFERCRAGVFGGALQIELGGLLSLSRCLIVDSEARFGGAVAASFTGEVVLDHCTVAGGVGLSAGAAIYVDTSASVSLLNSIACCATSGDLVFCGAGDIIVDHSNVWNDDTVNLRAEFGGECSDPNGANGNLREDPQVCPSDPDFGLQAGSPCEGNAADGSDMGWRPVSCASAPLLNLQDSTWGQIKALYRTP